MQNSVQDSSADARILQMLETRGHDLDVQALTPLVEKFKQNEAALKALAQGVARHGKKEYRGNYAENGSPGYDGWLKKHRLVEAALKENENEYLGRIDAKTLALPPPGAAPIQTVQPLPFAPDSQLRAVFLEVLEAMAKDGRDMSLFSRMFNAVSHDTQARDAIVRGVEKLERHVAASKDESAAAFMRVDEVREKRNVIAQAARPESVEDLKQQIAALRQQLAQATRKKFDYKL